MKNRERSFRDFFRSDLAVSIFVYCLYFLLAFRADWAFSIRRLSDENSYLSWLDVFEPFLKPDPEGIAYRHLFHAPGTSLVWLPADLLGRLVAHLSPGNPVSWRWSIDGMFSSSLWIVCFYLGILAAEELGFIAKKAPDRARRVRDYLFVFALVSCTQIAVFAFTRPIMSHTVELMFAFAGILFAWRGRFAAAFVFSILLTITRYNDLPVFLVVLGRFVDVRGPIRVRFRSRGFRWFAGIGVVFFAWVAYVGLVRGYGGSTVWNLFPTFDVWEFYRLFIALDWGLIFLLPFWWIAVYLAIRRYTEISFAARGSLIWLLGGGVLCLLWGGNGNSFGLRYLIGSSVAAMVIWSDYLRIEPARRKFFNRVIAINGAWLAYLGFMFWTVEPGSFVGNQNFLVDAFRMPFDPTFFRLSFGRTPIAVAVKFLKTTIHPRDLLVNTIYYQLSYESCVVTLVMLGLVVAYLIAFGAAYVSGSKNRVSHSRL